MTTCRKQILISGIVQGVGFRPFVWQLAHQLGLTGWVKNETDGVAIKVQGDRDSVVEFLERLCSQAPPLALIHDVRVSAIAELDAAASFRILDSGVGGSASTPIAADVAPCAACLSELLDSTNRRYRYPFINCTHCGPRFSIIQDLPYDRQATTMHGFSMCAACRHEYDDPADRRFQAQPIACAACGPNVWFLKGAAACDQNFVRPDDTAVRGDAAITLCRTALRNGMIVAVKGIGGFHLACDATNTSAVQLLRTRKGRGGKPLAVMVKDLEACHELADVGWLEQRALISRERPIVLLRKSPRCDVVLAANVAPSSDLIGLMLPYSPLHYLLLEDRSPLVMTSGNVAEEPIVSDNVDAKCRLANIADAYLLHDRPIHNFCDDSVLRYAGDRQLPIRRSRGYAPMPIQLEAAGASVLAVGGELKSTFCLSTRDYAYISQHIGDMGNLETLKSMEHNVSQLANLLRVKPTRIVADRHPGYISTQWARDQAEVIGAELVQVQHHHAHLASLAAEHRWPRSQPLLGFVFDGTGYGEDGAIWGGEVLLMRGSACERVAHLRYSSLPGGDASIRHPYRAALAYLFHCGIEWNPQLPCVQACGESERRILRQQLEQKLNCVPTSSMGRLFDAVASLLGIRHSITYEAQAAMELEAVARRCTSPPRSDPNLTGYHFAIVEESGRLVFDATPVIAAICTDVLSHVAQPQIARDFHNAVVRVIVELCQRLLPRQMHQQVGLTGGVFQNAYLLEAVISELAATGVDVLVHQLVPANDGGLSLGQAWIALGVAPK